MKKEEKRKKGTEECLKGTFVVEEEE